MKTVTLVLHDFAGPVEGDVIGVDYGALVCLNKGISMTLACGDFDSVSDQSFQSIKELAFETIKLPTEKDDTDFSFAYKQCRDYERILVLGGLGRRRDHEYVHIATAIQDSRLCLKDEHNIIQFYNPGVHAFTPSEYTYFSVIVIGESEISLEGFKYPLFERKIKPTDTYLTSNEIVNEEGIMTLKGHGVLVIMSKDYKSA